MVLVLLTAHATRFLHAEFFFHSFFFLEKLKLRLEAQAFLLSFKGLTQLKIFFYLSLAWARLSWRIINLSWAWA